MPKLHAVQKLFEYRVSISTKPFASRGNKVDRCQLCRIAKAHCICGYKPAMQSNAGFLLIMFDDEVLKPSNTGRLIADLVTDTYAFLWARTTVEQALLDLLADPKWQPFIVFPRESCDEERTVYQQVPKLSNGKRPLFVLFDGTWRQARRMFSKSPYLEKFPILSLDISAMTESIAKSQYGLRKTEIDGQLATAEIAGYLLSNFGEEYNGQLLLRWFDLFSYHYQKGVCKRNQGNVNALENLQQLVASKPS